MKKKERKEVDLVSIGNAELIFQNFSATPTKFNPHPQPGFSVILPEDLAKELDEVGWNVKELKPRDEEDVIRKHLPVAFTFDAFPPRILMISSNGQTILNSETVKLLDSAEIKKVDLVLRPYQWEVNGKTGIKAYLKAMYVTIVEDEFEAKYNKMLMDSQDKKSEAPEEDDGYPS